MVSSECGKRKKRIGRRATWKEDHITEMVNIIVNDDQLVKKLIFCNTKKASNTEAYEMVRKRLNVEYNKTTGSDFPFQVQQMRNKFKSCISTCKQICMTMKTASGMKGLLKNGDMVNGLTFFMYLLKLEIHVNEKMHVNPLYILEM